MNREEFETYLAKQIESVPEENRSAYTEHLQYILSSVPICSFDDFVKNLSSEVFK